MTPFYKLFWLIFFSFLFLYLLLNFGLGLEGYLEEYLANIEKFNFALIAIIIIIIIALDFLLPVPSSLIMITSGIIFGGLLGGILSLVGGIIGSIINFELSRKFGKKKAHQFLGNEDSKNLIEFFNKKGALLVVLSRIIPLIMETVSTIAGLSNMSRKNFIVYSLIGLTPTSFLYSFSGEYFSGTLSLYFIVITGFILPFLLWKIVINTN